MDFQAIFSKTPRGVSEIKNRAARLPRNLLSVLALVDGKSTFERLLRESKLSEVKFRQAIDRLEEDGFIKACKPGEGSANATPDSGSRRLRPARHGDLDELDFSAIARTVLEDRTGVDSGRASEIRSPLAAPPGNESEVAVARAAAETEARRVAEEALRAQAAAEAKARADEEARVRAEAHARAEMELRARVAAEAEARSKAEARARIEAHMKAEAERKARTDAERRAEEERQARESLEAKLEAEKAARAEAEKQAREDAERKAREETEARLAEELRNREEAQRRAREELERKAREELEARLAEERLAREEAQRRARDEAEQRAREEMELRLAEERRVREELAAQLAAEHKAKEEAEQRAREAIERKAQEEAERQAREEAQRLAHEEAERVTREALESRLAAERRAREEAEQRAEEERALREREQAQRRAEEEAERHAREEAERRASEEAVRRAAEEAEQRAREEAALRAREEAERRMREELEADLATERKAREAAERRAEEEAAARAVREREEAQRQAAEEAEQRAREQAALEAREEAEQQAGEAAEREAREEATRRVLQAFEQRAPDGAGAAVDAGDTACAEPETSQPEFRVADASEAYVEEQSSDPVEAEAVVDAASIEHTASIERAADDTSAQSAEVESLPAALAEPRVLAETSVDVETDSSPNPALASDVAPPAQIEVPPFFEIDLDALDARERELRAEEEEKLKLEAERHARDLASKDEAAREALAEVARLEHEAEETARREAEAAEQAALEDERRRVEEAERAAQVAERSRLEEAERSRREEEERRIADEVARRERLEAEQRMRADAERRERELAEAKAEAEVQRKAAEKLRKKQEKEEARARKRAAAEERARARQAAKKEATPSASSPKRRAKWHRSAAVGAALALLLAIALVHLLPWNGLVPRMEKVAASAVGEPVKIGSVHAAILPSPRFLLEDVVIGEARDVKIATARAVPELSSLFAERKVLSSLELDSVTADVQLLPRLPAWFAPGSGKSLQVAQVVLRNVKLEGTPTALPAFGGEVRLGMTGEFAKAALRSEDGKLRVDLRNKTDGMEADFSARGWRLPFGPGIDFEEVTGKGWLSGKELTLNELTARLYGGTATGRATLVWNSPWTLTGDFNASQLDLAAALKAFTRDFRATGRLDASGRYAAQSAVLGRLLAEPQVEAGFKVERGEIENFDLTRALQTAAAGSSVRGGKTQFAQLSGTVKVTSKSYQYRQLALSSGLLLANGTTDMGPSGDLAGRLNVELAAKPNPIRALVAVSGKLSDPQLKATR